MSMHEQFGDDLAMYALGTLTGEERVALEKHLSECADCRRELEELRGAMALLAFSVSGPKPPSRSRDRLMAAIAKEPRLRPVPVAARRRWWRPLEWAFAAAAVVILFLIVGQNGRLRRQIASLESGAAAQGRQLDQAENLVGLLNSKEAERFTLVASQTPPQPQGKVIYARRQGTLVFLASNMPQLQPEKTYELWLIPANGAPIPAGIFKPDEHGSATVLEPPLPPGTEAKTFAITVEPDGGTKAPTSKPIMVGTPG